MWMRAASCIIVLLRRRGDVLSFVMKHRNLPFVDAIQLLADQYHINLPRREHRDPQAAQAAEAARTEQEELYRVIELAADFSIANCKTGRSARLLGITWSNVPCRRPWWQQSDWVMPSLNGTGW